MLFDYLRSLINDALALRKRPKSQQKAFLGTGGNSVVALVQPVLSQATTSHSMLTDVSLPLQY